MKGAIFIVVACLVADAAAFKFLSNFKASSLIPRPSNLLKRRRAAEKFGTKKLAVITDASSGLGLKTAAELLRTGEYHVFGATHDLEKMSLAAKNEDFSDDDFTPLEIDLRSFESVRSFCQDLQKTKLNKPIDRLICNAAAYHPGETPEWSEDGHEQTVQVNYLSHFLMVSLLLPDLVRASDPRVILVGAASAKEGVGVYPRADLCALEGLAAGAKNPISMLDGYNFNGAKAYKDSKLSLSMLSNMLHSRYARQTGIAFSTAFPGRVEDDELFQDVPPLDTFQLSTGFVKTLAEAELSVLRGLGLGDGLSIDGIGEEVHAVSTDEAAQRLLQVAHDSRCSKAGAFWSWLEGKAAEEAAAAGADLRAGWESIYESEPTGQVLDKELSRDLWRFSSEVTGASWPAANQPKSPCPTLKVVGAVSKAMIAKEEAKRALEGLQPGETLLPGGVKAGLGGKVLGSTIGVAGTVVDSVAGNTIGRVAKLAQDRLLGGVPTEAVEGSYQETVDKAGAGAAGAGAAGAGATADADAELQQTLTDALDGGIALTNAEAMLEACVGDEVCEAEVAEIHSLS